MTYWEKIENIRDIAAAEGFEVLAGEPLSLHTSVKVGGKCDLMLFAPDSESAARLYFKCKAMELYTMVLGNGSNCLFSDDGFRGVIIVPAPKSGRVTVRGNVISASAGTPLSEVCKAAQQAGLTGLEFAYGIPGTVGGAVYMNAGAYGGEIKGVIKSVEAMNESGKAVAFTPDELELGYRTSRFERTKEIIISASFGLSPKDSGEILQKMNELIERRKSRQPLEYPSFGSAFKRPEGTYAGLVIEESGLKGASLGGARISPKHANFIVNLGNATSKDIIGLIELTQKTVKEKTGFSLEPEVRLIPAEPEKSEEQK